MSQLLVRFLLLIAIPVILYGGFLHNPLVFDDLYFFLAGSPEKYVASGFQAVPRWWAYYSLGLTFVYFGPELPNFRLGNLALHIGTGFVLYFLIRRLLNDLDDIRSDAVNVSWAAALATLLFLLHPVAVYASGYLIQRTILMSTLFSMLTWLAFWHGIQGSRRALWSAPVFYFFAVYSKEHAVMAPAVCYALLMLHNRSGFSIAIKKIELTALFGVFGAIALLVILQVKGVIGVAYEPFAQEMLRDVNIPEHAHVLSILTQAAHYFHYLILWLLPNVAWMSIDMREAFQLSLYSPAAWLGFGAFLAYGGMAAYLLSRGGVPGLLGFSFVVPWLMFMTEFSSVRIQEIFVLYRSYLWMPLVFLAVALGLRRLTIRVSWGVGIILALGLFLLSFDRLTSFSHPFLLWDEAVKLAEKQGKQPGVTGLARIYHNRGLALYRAGFVPNAIHDYNRALVLKPDYSYAYNDRGAARLDLRDNVGALADFNEANRLDPDYTRPYVGVALALERLGRLDEAAMAYSRACQKGWVSACNHVSAPQRIGQ